MFGMRLANHGSIGLRSKCLSDFSRNLVIQSGSPFHHEMSRTTCLVDALLGLEDVLLGVAPAELVLTEIEFFNGHGGTSEVITTTPIVVNPVGALETPSFLALMLRMGGTTCDQSRIAARQRPVATAPDQRAEEGGVARRPGRAARRGCPSRQCPLRRRPRPGRRARRSTAGGRSRSRCGPPSAASSATSTSTSVPGSSERWPRRARAPRCRPARRGPATPADARRPRAATRARAPRCETPSSSCGEVVEHADARHGGRDLVVGRVGPGQPDVVEDRALEQVALLRHDGRCARAASEAWRRAGRRRRSGRRLRSGRTSATSSLASVDLPAPVGPTSAIRSPGCDRRSSTWRSTAGASSL